MLVANRTNKFELTHAFWETSHIRTPLATGFLRTFSRVFVIEFCRHISNPVFIRVHRRFNQNA
jgi:hypothetical protein